MSKPLKFSVRRDFRHKKETDDILIEKSKEAGVSPGEYIRMAVLLSVTNKIMMRIMLERLGDSDEE